jgi:hypothetical protein
MCGEGSGVTFTAADSTVVDGLTVSRFVGEETKLIFSMLFSTVFSDRGFLLFCTTDLPDGAASIGTSTFVSPTKAANLDIEEEDTVVRLARA